MFEVLAEVRRMTADWIRQYNHERPREALGSVPPAHYATANC